MIEPRFFVRPEPLDLERLLALTGATAAGRDGAGLAIRSVSSVERAGPSDLSLFMEGVRPEMLGESRAGALLLSPEHANYAPAGAVALLAVDPLGAFARVAAALYPAAARPQAIFGPGVAPGAVVHPEARLEPDVSVDPGAVIGPRAEIGRGAVICANAVIGADVRLGRGAAVGPGASIVHALIGDRVTIQQGVRIGQGGLSLLRPRERLPTAPPIGRAIVQDDVEIGANATIDRGSDRDTVIGEAAKIDNLVHIGQNVVIGRHCVIFADAVIEEGARLKDYSVLGRSDGRSAAVMSAPGVRRAPSA
ncbi:MAG TPA: UDP-3-O-(3-hydroxymyristoyl)glucosamine N-acyltransferase [Hansschlegelia sp.]